MEEKIIIVDDENHILSACRRTLRDEPFPCLTFSSPKEALTEAAAINPAVVIADQQMPEMEGICFLEKIKEQVPLATRVIMTGYADINVAVDSINKGHVFRFIKKPWDDRVFKQQILQAIEYYRMNQRLWDAAPDIARESISKQERLQGVLEMAGAVCHEFAQPLQVIIGYCNMLTSPPRQEADIDLIMDYLSCIEDAADDLGKLLIKVMAIKKYKTKAYMVDTRIVDIDASTEKNNIRYRMFNGKG